VPELSRRRRLGVLAICCLSLLIVGMDNTIVNVALPAIHRDLSASLSDLQWTVDAYTRR
jgi:MFS family permease